MLDLKAKLLAAGVVTADQVKKVEDEQAARQAREKERREAERRRREEGPPPRDRDARGDRGDRGPRPDRGDRPRGPRDGDRPGPRGDRPRGPRPPREPRPEAAPVDGAPVEGVATEGADGAAAARPPRGARPRDTRSFKERRAEENLEKRARREHEWTESLRWRDRLDALKAAGKSEQYEAVRGWVMKLRLDNTQISEAAQRFFFTTYAGTLSHLTVEPDIHQQLVDGAAGIVSFIGYNGQEHAVVPKDVAVDVRAIKPEWLRHLIGITDLEPPLVRPTPEPTVAADATDAAEGETPAEGLEAEGEGAAVEPGDGEPMDTAAEAPSTEPEAG